MLSTRVLKFGFEMVANRWTRTSDHGAARMLRDVLLQCACLSDLVFGVAHTTAVVCGHVTCMGVGDSDACGSCAGQTLRFCCVAMGRPAGH